MDEQTSKRLEEYYKKRESPENLAEFISNYDGNCMCDCDHGCRQWLFNQRFRTGLILRILSTKGYTTDINKVTSMPLEKANQIFWRLLQWDCQKFNRELRKQEAEELQKAIETAAVTNPMGMGAPGDLFIPDYGWVLKDGKPTKEGKKWYREVYSKKDITPTEN